MRLNDKYIAQVEDCVGTLTPFQKLQVTEMATYMNDTQQEAFLDLAEDDPEAAIEKINQVERRVEA